jgi:sodium transport system permease protein
MFLFSGCMAIAPESIAGEKERGTIATLLVTPMKRSELALGKIISLSVIGLLSGLSSFIGTMLSLPHLMGSAVSEMSAGVYSIADYILLLLVILTTVLIIIGMISIISGYAKSVKEAGTAVTPLMIIIMVISITAMMGSGAPEEPFLYLIPLYNSVQCMNGIFSFTMIPLNLVITIVSNLLYAALAVFALAKIFDSEKIMYNA